MAAAWEASVCGQLRDFFCHAIPCVRCEAFPTVRTPHDRWVCTGLVYLVVESSYNNMCAIFFAASSFRVVFATSVCVCDLALPSRLSSLLHIFLFKTLVLEESRASVDPAFLSLSLLLCEPSCSRAILSLIKLIGLSTALLVPRPSVLSLLSSLTVSSVASLARSSSASSRRCVLSLRARVSFFRIPLFRVVSCS